MMTIKVEVWVSTYTNCEQSRRDLVSECSWVDVLQRLADQWRQCYLFMCVARVGLVPLIVFRKIHLVLSSSLKHHLGPPAISRMRSTVYLQSIGIVQHSHNNLVLISPKSSVASIKYYTPIESKFALGN
jgi:hypothetical protein